MKVSIKTNPTQDHKKPRRAGYGEVKRKVLATLLYHYDKKRALKPKEIAEIIKCNVSSVKTALRQLRINGIVRRTSKGCYILTDKQKAISILEDYEQINRIYLGRIPTSPQDESDLEGWFRRFVDVDSAIFEHARVKFRVDRFVTEKLREGCVYRPRDRAKQVSYSFRSFTMTVSLHGCVRINVKDPNTWLRDLISFLKSRGLDEKNIKYFLRQLLDALPSSRVTVEVPLVADNVATVLKGTYIETKLGDKPLVTRICASHFPNGELEITSDFMAVSTFLAALAGSQHFSMLEYAQLEKLNSIDKKFEFIASILEKLAKGLRDLAKPQVSVLQPQQEVGERNANYIT